MTCDAVRDRLDEWLDGRLAGPPAAELEAHLAGCAECRIDVDAARAVRPAAAHLPRAIQPERDLWAGIAGRLRPRGRRELVLPTWALAAAALLLIIASSGVTVALLRARAAPAASTLPAGFAAAEARAVATADRLTRAYRRSGAALAPATREVIDRNLAVIDRALAESRAALERDPHNAALGALVLAAWQRKIEFLERVGSLDRET